MGHAQLRSNVALNNMLEQGANPPHRAPHATRGFLALRDRLHTFREERGKSQVRIFSMSHKYEPLHRTVNMYERVTEAMAQEDVGRVATVMDAKKR